MKTALVHRVPWTSFLMACGAVWTAAPGFAAKDAGPVGGEAPEAVEAPVQAPVPNPGGDHMNAGQLVPRHIAADPLEHRGGVYTDAGEGLINQLNQIELSKLDRARRAVELARAAGTLYMTELPGDIARPTDEELSAMKLQRLATQAPQVLEDPNAGLGDEAPAVLPAPATSAGTDVIGDRSPEQGPRAEDAPIESPATEEVSGD